MTSDAAYVALRNQLERLNGDFRKASDHWPGLYQQMVWTDLPVSEWNWFKHLRMEPWQEWEATPDDDKCHRYSGNQAAFAEFCRLAETGYRLLQQAERLAATNALPQGSEIALSEYGGHFGWIEALFETAMYQMSAGLWMKEEIYDLPDQLDALEKNLNIRFDKRYPPPRVVFGYKLVRDLMLSSAEAIECWLNPQGNAPIEGRLYHEPLIILPGSRCAQELKDGPLPPPLAGFVIDGITIPHVAPRELRLLNLLWEKKSVPRDEAIDFVYEVDADFKANALKCVAKRLARRLDQFNVPRSISLANGFVTLEALRPGQ